MYLELYNYRMDLDIVYNDGSTELTIFTNHICATNLGFLKKIVKTSEKKSRKIIQNYHFR